LIDRLIDRLIDHAHIGVSRIFAVGCTNGLDVILTLGELKRVRSGESHSPIENYRVLSSGSGVWLDYGCCLNYELGDAGISMEGNRKLLQKLDENGNQNDQRWERRWK